MRGMRRGIPWASQGPVGLAVTVHSEKGGGRVV